ncbi:ABC transporter permease [Pararobbsia alpina]|uniref:Ribose import permease protein RbsC n=1 Tax=Pararobbsia alpina TaxID=621374 RepID=A0A6S7BB87_9BURK|nr:ABC transporter permease [Pararobbsia alpina]CAB3792318.1 Ribose import permease protein RbsC [Pararobbsia alpina]
MNTQTSPVNVVRQGRAAHMQQLYRRYGIVAVLILLCIVLTFSNQYFLTWGNIADILRQTSINGILAVGMTYVVLTSGIDLSVGSTLALAGMVSASVITGAHPHGVALGLLSGLVVGGLVGAVNGVLVARFAVPSFVATLGMLSVARGLTFIYSGGMPIADLPDDFLSTGTGTLAGIPVPVIIFALVVLLFWFILRYTTYGRYVYAVGGNVKSAKTSGISTGKIIFSVYVIGGILAGLAGIILAARTTSALPQAGLSYELDAIAAVVIGGTSLSGGSGSLGGTVVGALLIGVINNGLNLLGVSSYYQQVVKGVIIVGAVLLDASRKKS